jgi:hypothetical protein
MAKTANPLGGDLLFGAEAISKEIGQSVRKTFYLLEKGLLPAGKVGGQWVGSSGTIREHFKKITAGAI